MADNPVSPTQGTPAKPANQTTDEFLERLEVEAEEEKQRYMAQRVPPVMQDRFLAQYPPAVAVTPAPVDMEDVRQAKAKRGDPAPNEPKEYLEVGPDIRTAPEGKSDNLPGNEDGTDRSNRMAPSAPEMSRRISYDELRAREEELVAKEQAGASAEPTEPTKPVDPYVPPTPKPPTTKPIDTDPADRDRDPATDEPVKPVEPNKTDAEKEAEAKAQAEKQAEADAKAAAESKAAVDKAAAEKAAAEDTSKVDTSKI